MVAYLVTLRDGRGRMSDFECQVPDSESFQLEVHVDAVDEVGDLTPLDTAKLVLHNEPKLTLV